MQDDELMSEHALCLRLGGMTVEQMREWMTHLEFLDWRAFFMRQQAEGSVR